MLAFLSALCATVLSTSDFRESLPPIASASPIPAAASSQDSRSEISLLFWATSISAHVEAGAIDTDADSDFGEHTNGAIALRDEWWKGDDYGILGELLWMRVDADTDQAGGDFELSQDLVVAELTFAKRVASGDLDFDLLLGMRVVDSQAELDRPGTGDADTHRTYVDPLVGARAIWNASKEWSAGLRADAGGFGSGSGVTGNAEAFAKYAFTKGFSMSAGYRAMGLHTDEGSSPVVDATLHGPQLALIWGF
jgi:hypothetical protein